MFFSDISTRNDLADFLKIPRNQLSYVLYKKKIENCYTSFKIPKKVEGFRIINSPDEKLKTIQQKLLEALCEYQERIRKINNVKSNISQAFEKNKNIFSNATIHKNKRIILKIDLENFFDSIHFGRVRGFFEKNKFFMLTPEVSTVIAQLTCYKQCLPQGAPTSPIISNMICQVLDMRLLKISKKYKLDYTRYADDLIFSTNNRAFINLQNNFMSEISNEITRAGFRINSKKTKLIFRNSKQLVTGLVVNQKLDVDHMYYKFTRAMANNLYSNNEFTINGIPGTINQLEGRFSFINEADKRNNKLDSKPHNYRNLNSREKQYQKFLFYKYFFDNPKPLILTEGKTDIVYIKAALKNLYKEYPTLINKNDDGKFKFNVSFFKRTDRIEYLLGFVKNGADALCNIYNYFSPKYSNTLFPYYLSYFSKLSKRKPTNPIIFLFDNELSNNSKPLHKFASHIHLSDDDISTLKSKLWLKLPTDENSNLYLTTNPIIDNKIESEIEDLFDINTLNHILNGKKFNRNDNYDTTKFYGKEIFSQYVNSNYRQLNFGGFKKLLDNINIIIEDYSL